MEAPSLPLFLFHPLDVVCWIKLKKIDEFVHCLDGSQPRNLMLNSRALSSSHPTSKHFFLLQADVLATWASGGTLVY